MLFSLGFSIIIFALALAGTLRGFPLLSLALSLAYAIYMYLPYRTAKQKVNHIPRRFSQFIPPYVPVVSDLPFSSFFIPIPRSKFREHLDTFFAQELPPTKNNTDNTNTNNTNNSNGDVVAFASFMGPVVYTRSMEHVKEMTVTNPWDFPKPTQLYNILKVFGENIVTADDGPVHKTHRTICNPAFSLANLDFSAQVASEQLSSLFGLWEAGGGEGEEGKGEEEGKVFRVDPERGLFNLTLSIISEAGFGKQFGLARLEEEGEGEGKGEMLFEEAMQVVSEKLIVKLLAPSFLYSFPIGSLKRVGLAFDVFEQTLREVMEEEEGGGKKKDLISLLVRANEQQGLSSSSSSSSPSSSSTTTKRKLSQDEIYGDIFMFLFAGHETTAGVLGWALRFLATNPEVQEKAHQEVISLFEEREEGGLGVSGKEAEKLVYCKCVFWEVMRCRPVVQIVPKWAERDTSLGGEEIKKGTIINIDIKGLHMNPKLWEDPKEFRPERFDRRISDPVSPHAFIPFSFGQRNCIGQKLAIVSATIAIARIVHRYKISVPEGITEKELFEEKTVLTTRCANPVKLVFQLRE